MSNWTVKKIPLSPPPLESLVAAIQAGLKQNFASASVSVEECPDLRQKPFNLAGEGLCGGERIADVGGVPNLIPSPNLDKYYDLVQVARDCMELGAEGGFVLGPGGGPFKEIGINSELMANFSYAGDQVSNNNHLARIKEDGKTACQVKAKTTCCGLMANLFASQGKKGPVLKVVAESRTGKMNFTDCIRAALKESFPEQTISLGGVFLIEVSPD